MDTAALFRQRLKHLILERYRSLDRFYLETDFSKGHLSEILRGVSSPSVATLIKLAQALEVEVKDFFLFPQENRRHRALALVETCSVEALEVVLRLLSTPVRKTPKKKEDRE